MYTLVLSEKFQKQLHKLLVGNPRLRAKTIKALSQLNTDPDYPGLRLHKLSGLNNWSVSVTIAIRIIIHIEGDKIYCLSIGSHEEVY